MNEKTNLTLREEILLKSLVESFITDGQPVGSDKLSRKTGVNISSATIRNVFVELEDMGLIYSPHKSSGRIPTIKGYRLFVDTMIKLQPVNYALLKKLKSEIIEKNEKDQVVKKTSEYLSNITELTGLISLPASKNNEIKQIEFVNLSENKVLVVIVLSNDKVENKILSFDKKFSDSDLQQASNYLNSLISNKSISSIRKVILSELNQVRKDMNTVMLSAINLGKEVFIDKEIQSQDELLISGQTKLMQFEDLSDVNKLKTLFEAFNEKRNILSLFDKSITSDGVKIFIGSESGFNVLDDCSVVSAPYKFEDDVIGVLGVIGPKRMAYDRVIPIVDVTARLLSEALKS